MIRGNAGSLLAIVGKKFTKIQKGVELLGTWLN